MRAAALGAVLLLGGCAASASAPGIATAAMDDTVAITIARGACYGTCPVWTATLNDTGALAFEGKRFTVVTGMRNASRAPEAFAAFRDFVAPYRPARGSTAQTQDCAPMVTDHPTITVTWTARDGTRTVLDHYTGCRSESARATTEALNQVPEWLGITEWTARAR